jgi:hypothetical protein
MLWIKAFRNPANHLRDRNPHAGRRTDKITRGNADKRQNTRGEKCEVSNEKLINEATRGERSGVIIKA